MQHPGLRIIKHFLLYFRTYFHTRAAKEGNKTKQTVCHTHVSRALHANRHPCAGGDVGEGEHACSITRQRSNSPASAPEWRITATYLKFLRSSVSGQKNKQKVYLKWLYKILQCILVFTQQPAVLTTQSSVDIKKGEHAQASMRKSIFNIRVPTRLPGSGIMGPLFMLPHFSDSVVLFNTCLFRMPEYLIVTKWLHVMGER